MRKTRWLKMLALAGPLVLAGCSPESLTGQAGGQALQSNHSLAVLHFSSGRYGLAVDYFEKATYDDPQSIDSLNGLGASYDKIGRYDLAERSYRRALAIDPDSTNTLNNLGYSYWLQGRYDLAFAYLREAGEGGLDNPIIANNQQLALAALDGLIGDDQVSESDSVVDSTAVETERDALSAEQPQSAGTTWIERTDARTQTLVTQPDPTVLLAAQESDIAPKYISNAGPKKLPMIETNVEPTTPWNGHDALSVQSSGLVDQGAARALPPGAVNASADRTSGPDIAVLTSAPTAPLSLIEQDDVAPQRALLAVDQGSARDAGLAPPSAILVSSQSQWTEAVLREDEAAPTVRFDGAPLGPTDWTVATANLDATQSNEQMEDRVARFAALAKAQVSAGEGGVTYKRGQGRVSPESAEVNGANTGALAPVTEAAKPHARQPVIELANAYGVDGMAARMGQFLRSKGLPVGRLSNASSFGQEETRIIYGPGWQVYAMGLAALLPGAISVEAEGNTPVDIRIELGADLAPLDQQLVERASRLSEEPAG